MITKTRKPDSAFDQPRRTRGRPPGRTAEGDAMRRRLYETAIGLIAERGYEGATLRDVAARARVSSALLYKYFPSKRAVVLALYDELSEQFAGRADVLPPGRWRDRFVRAVESSLEVLGPHRTTLRALVPVFVGDAEEGVFADRTASSRARVHGVFRGAVMGAKNAPHPKLGEALGRLLYLAHLGVVLWWLLDRSPRQRSTHGLVALLRRVLPSIELGLRVPGMRSVAIAADALFVEGLLGAPVDNPRREE